MSSAFLRNPQNLKQSSAWLDVCLGNVNLSGRLFQIFVAFSEYPNFIFIVVSVVCGFDHTLWFHKFWTFSWKMSRKICKDVCECICRGQGRRNKKLLVNNLWGLLRSYVIMQMVRRSRICVVLEFEGVNLTVC